MKKDYEGLFWAGFLVLFAAYLVAHVVVAGVREFGSIQGWW